MAATTTAFEAELLLGALAPNGVLNPKATLNTANTATWGGNTITRETTTVDTGDTTAFKLTQTAADARAASWTTSAPAWPDANDYYLAQARVYIPAAWTGGTIALNDEGAVSGWATVAEQPTNMSLRDQWQTTWFVRRNNADTADDWTLFARYGSALQSNQTIYISRLLAYKTATNPTAGMPLTYNADGTAASGGFSMRDRGLMAGAAYKLRQHYLNGVTDPLAHQLAKNHPKQVDALIENGKLASFDAITAP